MNKFLNFLAPFVLLAILCCTSCNNRGPTRRVPQDNSGDTIIQSPQKPPPEIKPTVNVYIEGSGSIDAYTKGITELKDVLGNLIVKLKYYYGEENLQIFWIYNDVKEKLIIEKTATVADFANKIDVELKKLRRGNNTDLNNIFREIIQNKTDSATISILFSDCIYSIGSGGVIDMVNNGKNLTMDAFLTKSKGKNFNFSSCIFRMKSQFDGKYFPYTGDANGYYYRGVRPYYICVFANQDILDGFNKNIKAELEKFSGYEDKYVLSSENSTDTYWSVLQSTFTDGRFKPMRGAETSSNKFIRGITDVQLVGSGGSCSRREERPLTLAVAVDFCKIQMQVDSGYIANPNNYEVTTDNFEVVKIIPVVKNEIKPTDWNRICSAKPTHIILLKAKSKAVSNLSFALKKQMPQWIREKNTEDDTRPNELRDKTFGLTYWVEGIAEAYKTIYPNNKYYFQCTIPIKKNNNKILKL